MDNYKAGWKQFLALCQETQDEKMLSDLLDLLLTPEEKNSVAMRCLIIRELLQKDLTQREIAAHLNVSIAKITRGSNELKRRKNKLIQYLENLFNR